MISEKLFLIQENYQHAEINYEVYIFCYMPLWYFSVFLRNLLSLLCSKSYDFSRGFGYKTLQESYNILIGSKWSIRI